MALIDDDEHPLLRFAEQNFVRGHIGQALRDFGELNLDAGTGPGRRFAGGAGEPCRAHILNACDGSGGGQELQTGFD